MAAPPAIGNTRRPKESMSWISRIILPTRMVTLPWHREKTKDYRRFDDGPPKTRIRYRSTHSIPLPYDIVEMIIAQLTLDFHTLKASSLVCRSWYTAAASYLHHTLTLTGNGPKIGRSQLEPLSELRRLGLAPLVKEIRVHQWRCGSAWFTPQAFSSHAFSGFANIQALRLQGPDIHLFIPDIERSFGHFLPRLRSIVLRDPSCNPRQLSHFLSLFPSLENIDIDGCRYIPNQTTPGTEFVPFSAPKLRGRLVLYDFSWVETWTGLINSCGGLWFRHVDLWRSPSCAPIILDACAKTVETLRFSVTDDLIQNDLSSSSQLNLSRLKALRSLQVKGLLPGSHPADHRRPAVVMDVFSTITSPVFSELVVVIEGDAMSYPSKQLVLFETLRMMNEVRPFRLVLLLEVWDFYKEKARRKLAEALALATPRGCLDFLDSPPTICWGTM